MTDPFIDKLNRRHEAISEIGRDELGGRARAEQIQGNLDSHNSTRVVCAYYTDTKEETATFTVPENLLWSAAGMAYLFTALRASFMTWPLEGSERGAWDSWHIKSIGEDGGYVVEGILAWPPERIPGWMVQPCGDPKEGS